MAFGTRARFEAIKEAGFANILAAYSAVGTATTDHTRLITLHNTTDVEVYVSLDGSTNHLRMPSGEARVLDLTTNRVKDDGLFIAEGTTFWVKRVAGAPGSGSFWVEVMYADGGV